MLGDIEVSYAFNYIPDSVIFALGEFKRILLALIVELDPNI
jgi:hypothetical protein